MNENIVIEADFLLLSFAKCNGVNDPRDILFSVPSSAFLFFTEILIKTFKNFIEEKDSLLDCTFEKKIGISSEDGKVLFRRISFENDILLKGEILFQVCDNSEILAVFIDNLLSMLPITVSYQKEYIQIIQVVITALANLPQEHKNSLIKCLSNFADYNGTLSRMCESLNKDHGLNELDSYRFLMSQTFLLRAIIKIQNYQNDGN